MRIPYVRGAAARLRSGAVQAPAVLRGFSGTRLRRRIASGAFGDREVLAARPTGFGSRMGELLNAHRVASALGARFAVHWPAAPLYDVGPPDAVFDPHFVAAHHLSTFATESFGWLTTTIEPSDLRRLADGPFRGARMRERYLIDVRVRGLELPSFREAFEAVRFHPDLERIRAEVDTGPRVGLAVHVRRPDLAFPTSRFGGRYASKQTPMALIERIVQIVPRDPRDRALLIGNDGPLLVATAERIGADTPDGVVGLPKGSSDQQAFRDFCLLARAGAVLGGTSAFARVAQLIAGSRVIQVEDILPADEIRTLLWTAVMRGDANRPLEATLASDHLFQRRDIRLTLAEEVALLERTVELDPEDPTRWLGLLVRRVRQGDRTGAERTMAEIAVRFAGDVGTAARQTVGGRTGLEYPGHLTDDDWRDLFTADVLDATWSDALRAAADGAPV
jgi:hypothetical protein